MHHLHQSEYRKHREAQLRLAQVGVDMKSLKQLMGHAIIVITMRYAHLAPDYASKKRVLMPAV